MEEHTGSDIVRALEDCCARARQLVPEVPLVVVNVDVRRRHFLARQAQSVWSVDGKATSAVTVARSALELEPVDLLEVVLHELAHGLAAARGWKDTSNRARYHNKRFKTCAEELGLEVRLPNGFGYARTACGREVQRRYARCVRRLARVLNDYPKRPLRLAETEVKRRVSLRCSCKPARNLRLLREFHDQGPVICSVCHGLFLTKDEHLRALLKSLSPRKQPR